jgi:T4-like virus tail tube protein gp19
MKVRAVVVLVVLALAGSVATPTLADDASGFSRTAACTPQRWSPGCTTPLSLSGLIHLLNSPAAALAPLQLLAVHYVVWADACATNLGSWAKADGLDGAGDVTLTRGASAESLLVRDWLTDLTFSRHEVTITLVTGLGEPLQTWQLQDVVPLSWTINAFDAASSKIAIETLELAHEGLRAGTPC